MKYIFYIKCCLLGLITGVVNGLFGAGGGTIIVPALKHFLKVESHIAHATAISIILPLTIASSFVYIHNNFVEWDLVIKASIGGIAGGFIGAKLLKITPTKYLSKIFGIVMIIASVRMVFF